MQHKPTLRVLNILELLAHSKELSLTQIAKALDMPPSTLLPILQTLQERHYIMAKDKSYALAGKILELSLSIKQEQSILDRIKKYMRAIRDFSNQTCQMGVLRGGEVLYIAKIEGNAQVQVKSFVGASYPAYATALGKVLLCGKSKEDLKKLYPKPFVKITANTVADIEALYAQLKRIKKEQIALESGEMNAQIECMAFGIEHKGRIRAAISISYPIFYANEELRERNRGFLLTEKEKIAKDIAANPSIYDMEELYLW